MDLQSPEKQNFKKNYRKQLLINPDFQLKILNYVSILNLSLLMIFFAVNFLLFEKMKDQGLSAGLPENHIYFEFLNSQQKGMVLLFLGGSIVSIIMIYWFGFYISNRIAGPIYNVTMNIDRMIKSGKVVKIRFRKGDFFPELADKLNELTDHASQGGGLQPLEGSITQVNQPNE
jgi:hypothetical protein